MQPTRLERLFEMLKEEPGDSFLLYAIATEYVKLNEEDKALRFYLELIEKDEEYVGVYYHLAKLYERVKRAPEAEETYKKGMLIARRKGDNHAFAELQSAYNSMMGLDYEDE